jgi:hypothetical protein
LGFFLKKKHILTLKIDWLKSAKIKNQSQNSGTQSCLLITPCHARGGLLRSEYKANAAVRVVASFALRRL